MLASIFTKRQPKVGAKPGTLVVSAEAPTPRVRLMGFDHRDTQREIDEHDVPNDELEQLTTALDDGSITWVDVQGFGDKKVMRKIGSIFDLHPLLLEDVVNVPQRPKTEAYGDQILMIVRMVWLSDEGQVEMEQVSFVLGKNYVLTFQEKYGDVFNPVRKRIRDPKALVRQHGADYLGYALIDTVIDGYYPVLETIGDRLELLEGEVISNPSNELLGELNSLKNRLVNLRRGIWPQREAVMELARGEHALISDDVRLFFRDTYDHCVQASEVTEMYREMVTGLMNVYLTSIANRTNEVMKVLTIVATIFIPLTFIAGIYGMNFDHMPELHNRWGYPLVWVTMVVTSVVMLGYFWRKGWIGPGSKSE